MKSNWPPLASQLKVRPNDPTAKGLQGDPTSPTNHIFDVHSHLNIFTFNFNLQCPPYFITKRPIQLLLWLSKRVWREPLNSTMENEENLGHSSSYRHNLDFPYQSYPLITNRLLIIWGISTFQFVTMKIVWLKS